MKIGIPKEIKDNEYRIGMIPAGVRALVDEGHEVVVERGAGDGSGFLDEEFVAAGAKILDSADAVWAAGDMIIKVKEPVGPEYERMRPGQILYTYLHLAPEPELTDIMLERRVTGVAYETVTDNFGHLPLLTPMSEVAGRLAIQVGAYFLQRPNGGRGVLPGGVPGVPSSDVVIIGGGVVGINSAKMALGLGAHVTILDNNLDRLRYLDDVFSGHVTTVASNRHNIEQAAQRADILVGGVLLPGHSAPKLVTRDMLTEMKDGSVIVDVAVDQGGCVETTKPTTHSNPVFEIDGVIHYCVANMPGAVPRTSTFALTNATLPFAIKLANEGLDALRGDVHLRAGMNTHDGRLTCEPVADSQGKPFTPAEVALGMN
jgi:alanine dehydrogenase